MADPIRRRDHVQQIKRFDGLKFHENIRPTDIDAFLDFGNQLFVFIETKRGKAKLQGGQRWALERLCDACETPERKSILLVTSHRDDGDIDLASTRVVEMREGKKWIDIAGIPLRQMIDELLRRYPLDRDRTVPWARETGAPPPSRPGPRKAAPFGKPKKSSSTGWGGP